MLKNTRLKTSVVLVLAIFLCQLWLLSNTQLFGDESFYWLEGQFLAYSYTDLPGWTAWMIRVGTSFFGNHYFAVRFVSFFGFISVFLAIHLINKRLNQTKSEIDNFVVIFAIPLVALVSIMALPDIWMIVFTMWIVYFCIQSVQSNRRKHWIILGIVMACAMNVHVRMWIWLFFAGLMFLLCFWPQTKVIKNAILVTVPLAMLGFVPILWFNFQNDFALFQFQFAQRHPWSFQYQNFVFLVSQFIVITPLILFLWFYKVASIPLYFKQSRLISWVLLTALMHWLFYIVMSFFVDGLRTTVHWLLVSYVPVISITLSNIKYKKLSFWAIIFGCLVTLILFVYILINKNYVNNTQARILDNSLGWNEMSQKVKKLQKEYKTPYLITDYFMTASELAFELNQTNNIKVLPHPKSIKHGRQKQLEIMNLLLNEPESYKNQAILVLEDSSIKLQDKGKYYAQLCQYFKQIELIDTLNIKNSKKQFHFFRVNNNDANQICVLPPLFYVEQIVKGDVLEISGWSILHNSAIQSLTLVSNNKKTKVSDSSIIHEGIADMFPEINDLRQPKNAFKIEIPIVDLGHSYYFLAYSINEKEFYSQNYFIE
ncbi:MAG: ArnT family glycosyltransferase [Marinicellaceae bacterium]